MWYVQSEEELLPPPAQAASDQEEEAEDDGARMQGTDIEQGNAKVCSPTAINTMAVLSCMMNAYPHAALKNATI